jgi:predicted AlkP superfamily pyrophosphatase or phosphodiesterase
VSIRHLRSSLPAALVLVALLAGCQAAPPAPADDQAAARTPTATAPAGIDTAAAAARPSADNAVDRVLAISVDGLNPAAIRRLGPSRTPAFHRLMREGASTLNARTAREQTRTLPNHTGMLTGRRIDDGNGGHGITFNSDTGSTVHRAADRYVASMFDVVHDRGGSTAVFTAKKKFALYQRTWNGHGAQDRVGKNHGRAKIDRFTVDTNNTRLVGKLRGDLRRSPRELTFLHLSLPDQAGHAHGFMGKRYLTAVRQTDRLLGQILDTIDGRAALRRHTLVVLTADHGGSGGTHGTNSRLANYRVPFMAWGPGVAAGRNLYRLNSTYRSPGSARTSYSGKQPIRNGDMANLVTDVLDLPRVPGSQFNRRRTLNVFG